MLEKEEINYLIMLIIEDKRKVVKSYKNNNQIEEAKKQKDVRYEIIQKLTNLYDN